jgi:glucose-6-phosphate isomerase
MINRSQNTVEKVRNEILDEIDSGKSVINFLGHGNLLNWTSANLLKTTDVDNFQNGSNTTIFVMLACLNGAYAETKESLAESLHKTPNGGAIAVWASSGQTYPYGQVVMSKAFYQQIFNIENIRIGDAIKFAKQQNPDLDIRKFSILFGDPTMKVRN